MSENNKRYQHTEIKI